MDPRNSSGGGSGRGSGRRGGSDCSSISRIVGSVVVAA